MEGNIFGTNLRNLRNLKGISLNALGEELNVTGSAISSWELGKKEPNLDMLKKIGNYFRVSIDYLLSHQVSDSESQKKEVVSKLATKIYEKYRDVPDSKKSMVEQEILNYVDYLHFKAQVEHKELEKLGHN
ncbi:helix-turn-helix domain-containing protein [Bacillus cereus]|nr:helix-turn-helix domain-containing protein [Bacillus cereus]MDA2497069.1 helix-turn-helix domain-containing protein [Bacillus cereus]